MLKIYVQEGKFIGEKSLIGFGQGKGSPEPDIKGLDMCMTGNLGGAQMLKVESNTFEELLDASLINPRKIDSNAHFSDFLAQFGS